MQRTDTPDAAAARSRGIDDWPLTGRMEPLRGRDADGRMVREPRRDPTKIGCRDPRLGVPVRRDHETSNASVSSCGGGRGEGRDVGCIIAANSRPLTPAPRREGRGMGDSGSPPDRPWGRSFGGWSASMDRQVEFVFQLLAACVAAEVRGRGVGVVGDVRFPQFVLAAFRTSFHNRTVVPSI